MLGILLRHQVEFVVIGGFAAELHDVPIPPTRDVDITPANDRGNLSRLIAALDELDARLRVPGGPDAGIPLPGGMTPEFLQSMISVALVTAVWLGVRAWKSGMPLPVKWGMLVMLTILASPHLLTYDLILLTIPLVVFADWAVAHQDHPQQPWISRLLLLLYLAPFSSNLVRLVPVQLSVVAMVVLVAMLASISWRSGPQARAQAPSRNSGTFWPSRSRT